MNVNYEDFAIEKFAEMKGWNAKDYKVCDGVIVYKNLRFNIDLNFFRQLPIKSNHKYLNALWAVLLPKIKEVYHKDDEGLFEYKNWSFENGADDEITMLIHNATLNQRLEAYWMSEHD